MSARARPCSTVPTRARRRVSIGAMAGRMTSLVSRGRALNWLALYEAAKFVYGHGKRSWEKLTPSERAEIGRMIRKSKGRSTNLTQRERDRLWTLVKKATIG
jgi:hypothetical protein